MFVLVFVLGCFLVTIDALAALSGGLDPPWRLAFLAAAVVLFAFAHFIRRSDKALRDQPPHGLARDRWYYGLLLVVVLACGYFIWPTPWREWRVQRGAQTVYMRTSRLTGRTEAGADGLFQMDWVPCPGGGCVGADGIIKETELPQHSRRWSRP